MNKTTSYAPNNEQIHTAACENGVDANHSTTNLNFERHCQVGNKSLTYNKSITYKSKLVTLVKIKNDYLSPKSFSRIAHLVWPCWCSPGNLILSHSCLYWWYKATGSLFIGLLAILGLITVKKTFKSNI